MNVVGDTVTSCQFKVIDPTSEEAVLMKSLQVLMACRKNRASRIRNQHACTIVNICLRISRHTMHEPVRYIFLGLPEVNRSTGKLSSLVEEINDGRKLERRWMLQATAHCCVPMRAGCIEDVSHASPVVHIQLLDPTLVTRSSLHNYFSCTELSSSHELLFSCLADLFR
ncbi:ARF guanine-nucleotide exchange factor GNOM [Platanthera zijinensis]|uniref:ARF guanine-nucleotide exchange factor GNOM n=1 Tax=Platanthera zijinensis TaxID=2320716 RepID=A0AAP0AZA8_9ASPA